MQFLQPDPQSTSEYRGQVRNWLEAVTRSYPFSQIDWTSYQVVLGWTSRADLLPIVEEALARRLLLNGAGAHKALPPASLVPLIESLKKLATANTTSDQLRSIAEALLASAQQHQAAATKAEADRKDKTQWEMWCGLYGTPMGNHQMPEMPTNPEWGMWDLVWVPKEEWWAPQAADGP